MLDTPLVRGERGVFIPVVGGVRLDMALGRREEGKNEYRWWALPCFLFKLARVDVLVGTRPPSSLVIKFIPLKV
jgi:hypothetical protein